MVILRRCINLSSYVTSNKICHDECELRFERAVVILNGRILMEPRLERVSLCDFSCVVSKNTHLLQRTCSEPPAIILHRKSS